MWTGCRIVQSKRFWLNKCGMGVEVMPRKQLVVWKSVFEGQLLSYSVSNKPGQAIHIYIYIYIITVCIYTIMGLHMNFKKTQVMVNKDIQNRDDVIN